MSDEVMLEVQRTLGRIEQKIDSHVAAFENHVQLDAQAWHEVGVLKVTAAKQKGYLAAMGAVGGGVVAALGYIADKLLGLGHH